MSNRDVVEQAYLKTPTAFVHDISAQTGLSIRQVRSARQHLVRAGKLPTMFYPNGAIAQELKAQGKSYEEYWDSNPE